MDAITLVSPVSPSERWLFLRELYETVYGIHNHVHDDDPLAPYLIRESKSLNANDPLKMHIIDFSKNRIKELYGMSLSEYLDQPPHIIKYLIEAAEKMNAAEQQRMAEIKDGLNGLDNKPT